MLTNIHLATSHSSSFKVLSEVEKYNEEKWEHLKFKKTTDRHLGKSEDGIRLTVLILVKKQRQHSKPVSFDIGFLHARY